MKRSHWAVVAGIVAILVLAAGAWAFWGERVDPAVAELEAERRQLFSGEATDAQRDAFRTKVEALTDEQRRQLFQRSRPEMQRRMSQRMDELFKSSPDDVRREARERAKDVIAARRQRASEPQADRRGGPGGPGEGFANMSEAERDQRRKQRLDRVDAETRGQMSEFRKLVDQELEAQGQPPLGPDDFRAMRGGPGR